MQQQTRPLCKCRNSFLLVGHYIHFTRGSNLSLPWIPLLKQPRSLDPRSLLAPVPPSILRFPVACCQVVPKTAVVAASSKTRGFFYIKVGWLELRKLVEWRRSFFFFFFHPTPLAPQLRSFPCFILYDRKTCQKIEMGSSYIQYYN